MRISNLSNKSGNPSSSDYLVLDDGTTVTKIDYNKLAKAIIENYAGSTIAGSAQSVKAALDSLNSNIKYGLLSTGSHDADTFEHLSSYMCYAAAVSNLPVNATCFILTYRPRKGFNPTGTSTDYGYQIGIAYTNGQRYQRIRKDAGWTPWEAI